MPHVPNAVDRRESTETWSTVDQYTTAHLLSRAHPAHQKALDNISSSGLPLIQSSPSLAKFLALQCKFINAKSALEVGALGGYTALWLLLSNPDLHLTTVEVDPKHAEVARQNFQEAGVADRVKLLVGSAVDVLPELLKEAKGGKRANFDFVFVDADKKNNWTYFDLAVQMSRSGACVVVDNVVWDGEIVSEDNAVLQRIPVKGAREVIEKAGKDERVEGMVMQNVGEDGYDGFLLTFVK